MKMQSQSYTPQNASLSRRVLFLIHSNLIFRHITQRHTLSPSIADVSLSRWLSTHNPKTRRQESDTQRQACFFGVAELISFKSKGYDWKIKLSDSATYFRGAV